MAGLIDIITIYTVTYPAGSGDETDRYGNPLRVEAEGVVVAAAVAPHGREGLEKETLAGQDRRTSQFRVIVGPDTQVDGLARVEWRGRSYEVLGEVEPIMYRNGLHHYQFHMQSVEGA